jgi:hypothetical protein
MNTLNNTTINRRPAPPQGAGKPSPKSEAAQRASSGWSTDRRVETDTETIAVLGYN